MCFTPSLSSTQSVSFYTQFPHDLSSPSSPGGCRRAQHLFDIPDVKIHLLFRSDAFAGSCRPSPWPRSAGPLLPPLLPHGGHAALHRGGQWRETISPARGECPPVSPRCGENLRGAHGPAGLEQAQLTRPPQGWAWRLSMGPTEPGGFPGSHLRDMDPRVSPAAQISPQAAHGPGEHGAITGQGEEEEAAPPGAHLLYFVSRGCVVSCVNTSR